MKSLADTVREGREAYEKFFNQPPPPSRLSQQLGLTPAPGKPAAADTPVGNSAAADTSVGKPAAADTPPGQSAPPAEQARPPQEKAPPVPEKPAPAQEKPEAGDSGEAIDWEQRYKSLQGKYNKEIAEMRRQADLIRALSQRIETPRPADTAISDPPGSASAPSDTTARPRGWTPPPELVEEVGEPTVRAIQAGVQAELRAVREELESRLAEMEGQYRSVSPAAHAAVMFTREQQLDQMVPGWRGANSSPDFVNRWLGDVDPLSGVPRMDLFKNAVQSHDIRRIAAFFQSYLAETGSVPQSSQSSPAGGAERKVPKANLVDLAVPSDGAAGGAVSSGSETDGALTVEEMREYTHLLQRGVRSARLDALRARFQATQKRVGRP